MMERDLLDPARHAGALAVAAARALRAGDIDRAHAFADRRCRIRPPAEAHDFLLRAASRRALGDLDGAIDDARTAATIDPDNLIAARWLLRAPSPAERVRAARVIARRETVAGPLGEAVAILAGDRAPAVGTFREGADEIEGWLAWRGTEPMRLTVAFDSDERAVSIMPDPAHALAPILGSAARVRIAWPNGRRTIRLGGFGPEAVILGTDFARTAGEDPSGAMLHRTDGTGPGVTVILPVYDDLASTRLCLATLLADTPRHLTRTIIAIDDATPDPEIARFLDEQEQRGTIRLLRNPVNLGFAASVNRALAGRPSCNDVLILNADTVLSPGVLDRLRRAAYSAPDIGTVTPLSNNGENTSLPRAFTENPLPSVAEIHAIDAMVATINDGRIIDLPNGTGFCLYITRACLDAVGSLGLQFGRGYLEDVDLCLRAAEAGFRNVCAADVYVGHAGSRSFGSDKRALVVRNLALIEAQFPGYERICAAFFASDPLAPVRAAVDARMVMRQAPAHLVVLAEVDSEAWLGVHRQVCGEASILVARVIQRAGRIDLALADAAGGFPQNLRLSAPLRRAGPRLAAALSRLPIRSVEVPFPHTVPEEVRTAVAALKRPLRTSPADPPITPPTRLPIGHTVPERVVALAPSAGTESFRLLCAIVRRWARDGKLPELAIVGATLDDLRLMGMGPVLVTGPVLPEEAVPLIRRLGATTLILLDPDHPTVTGMAFFGLRIAGLHRRCDSVSGRVHIDPTGAPEAVADRLARWVAGAVVERRVA
ncbi:glycosyltransferase family 2 protein [Methylobacterium aerolatum]|uniref:GT2 family glycosyltransferase n=1 Tax=Methylobacterium aerolatum TaxID=418708 RepID=A0ABU0I2J1_9HYPH|nr:glycosyltransferase family 2 protein [Methylobacterium aerolatum]MDQ0448815.1 GT2 family glycosyltransferase [Methylobacterium aerolatum]GJD34084.1 hypothetical protein FMGBMHLM_0980 [Methylobacterium aerolatum]